MASSRELRHFLCSSNLMQLFELFDPIIYTTNNKTSTISCTRHNYVTHYQEAHLCHCVWIFFFFFFFICFILFSSKALKFQMKRQTNPCVCSKLAWDDGLREWELLQSSCFSDDNDPASTCFVLMSTFCTWPETFHHAKSQKTSL